MGSDKKSIIIIGCGVLGSIIADGINDKQMKHYEISAVYDRQQLQAEKLAKRLGGQKSVVS
ncbi:MAG: NAD(P)-binding domain-containing protein [Clostridia bacterium]|nr:NAD(P)-binding domain-containing protein [Clostridia bacterium]